MADKDYVILYDNIQQLENTQNEINELCRSNDSQEAQLRILKERVFDIYKARGITPPSVKRSGIMFESPISIETKSYDEIYNDSSNRLIKSGIDPETIDETFFFSPKELDDIKKELDRVNIRRERWNKSDYIVVFFAAALGSLADIVLSSRDNILTGADPRKHFSSNFSEKLNQIHTNASTTHSPNAPIDYQGKGFGGGFHRELSKGHDIFRFVEGINMMHKGQFEAIRYENGTAIKVITKLNQYGNPYRELPIIEAVMEYAKHMFADAFSTCSLPFPGYSFLTESDNRQLRIFAADMYQNGFNIKNVAIQSLSTVVIELMIRIFFSIQSVRKYYNEVSINEDYSNWNAIKCFVKPLNNVKLNEMLLVAHTIVTAVNLGKCIIKKSPWEINVTELFSVVKYGINVLKQTIYRINANSEFTKLIRNADEIHDKWQEILSDDVFEGNLKSIIMTSNTIMIE